MNASERSLASRLIALTAISVLAGCGGGKSGGSTASPMVPVPGASSAPANVAASTTLLITIPGTPKTQASKRRARYVSSATNSLTFTIVGGPTAVIPLTSTSPNCSTDASGMRLCAINVSAPTGTNVPFVLSTFASVDGTGTPLSTARASQTISSGTTNQINVTLDAVVSAVQVAVGSSTFSIGSVGTTAVTVNALDAAGKLIGVGTNNLVDSQDNSVTISLINSENSATHLSATQLSAIPVTLSYDGGPPSTLNPTITATATSSGSTIASNSVAFNFNSAYVATIKADHPLVYYRMNEFSGSTAVDYSGNGYNASYQKTIAFKQPGQITGDSTAKSVGFANGYLSESETWTNPEVTAEAWIRPTATDLTYSQAPRLIGNAWTDNGGRGFMLWISSGKAAFNASWNNATWATQLTAGQSYHLVGTYSLTTGTTLYVNGLAVANMPGSLQTPVNVGDYPSTYFGVLNATNNNGPGLLDSFAGSMSEAAVYDHPLTPVQVAAHYNAGAQASVKPVPIPSPAPTIAPTAPPTPMPLGTPIAYDSNTACIFGTVYSNNVMPAGEGEFGTSGLDRSFWGRYRGNGSQNAQLGNWVSGFQTTWGRTQYNTYFGDSSDGLPGGHDPFSVGPDTGAPGNPTGLQITASMMPSDLVGNPGVQGQPYYAGTLMTPVKLTYGFIVARVRTPKPNPGLSPAFWVLQGQGVQAGPHGNLSDEWDIQEMFGNSSGDGMNQGELIWNSSASGPVQNWGGSYSQMPNGATSPSSDYHDYGVLISPGGAPISTNYNGNGGPGLTYGDPKTGATFYMDRQPVYGHTGGADISQTATTPGYKEIMAMYQVSANGWIGQATPAELPSSYWIQWIRVFQPTASHC